MAAIYVLAGEFRDPDVPVSFEFFLNGLLQNVDGTLSAGIYDSEGEVVQLNRREGEDLHRLRLVGAYESIFHRRLLSLLALSICGAPNFHVSQYSGGVVVTMPLIEGYFLYLYCEPGCNIGQAINRLRLARPHIITEM